MDAAGWDFWGMTENWELCRHIQSYFLVFRRPVLASPALPTFFESVLPFRNKKNVILAYESGVTNTIDPLAGSYFVEALTDQLEREALDTAHQSTPAMRLLPNLLAEVALYRFRRR